MFNLKLNELNSKPIVKWEVHFRTPFGMAKTLAEAVTKCKDSDLDPETCIIPTPMAINNIEEYEYHLR